MSITLHSERKCHLACIWRVLSRALSFATRGQRGSDLADLCGDKRSDIEEYRGGIHACAAATLLICPRS